MGDAPGGDARRWQLATLTRALAWPLSLTDRADRFATTPRARSTARRAHSLAAHVIAAWRCQPETPEGMAAAAESP